MILLDTCTLLWLVMEQARLSSSARAVLTTHAGNLHVSAVSAFEIGQKHAAGKLILPMPPAEWFTKACDAHGLAILDLTTAQAFEAAALPLHHRDPFDRLLIATAKERKLTLLTPDPLIHQYTEVSVRW